MNYSALAPYYDLLMAHVDYREWVDLIDQVTATYLKKPVVSLLEIGGGTGVLGALLQRKKRYDYRGSDFSFSMSRMAKMRHLPFFCADARFLPVKKLFDLVIFLYDGINYLTTRDEYRQLFASVADSLVSGGLFLFDITTTTNSHRHFLDYYDFQEYRDTSIVRHSYFRKTGSLQINDFTIFSPSSDDGYYHKQTEHHVQKLFSPEQISALIPQSCFICRGIWDGYSMTPGNNQSERIHFLLQKKAS